MFSKIGRTRNPQVPLGLLYLATLAEDKGHFVRFVDCDVEKVSTKDIAERVEKEKFDLVGLSATSPIFHKLVKTADAIKERCPDVVTIGGGDHINIYKKEVFLITSTSSPLAKRKKPGRSSLIGSKAAVRTSLVLMA